MTRTLLLAFALPFFALGCGGGQATDKGGAMTSDQPTSTMDEDAPNPCAAAPAADEDAPPADEDAPNPCAGG